MTSTAEKPRAGSRTRSRRLAMQAIYQWLLSDASLDDIQGQFLEDPESQSANQEYLVELMQGVVKHKSVLAEMIKPYLNRPFDEVDPVEKAVLLIAAYEFKHVLSIPYRAVINEAVELTKSYGAEDGYKFVNGVLDKLSQEVRATERS